MRIIEKLRFHPITTLFSKKKEWDAYVSQNDQSLFSHRYDWGNTLAAVYGLRIFRLVARDRKKHDEIVGLLPLIFFPGPGFDARLISLPYSDAAGIIADNTRIQEELLLAALKLAQDLGAVHLELRHSGGLAIPEINFPITHTPNRFKIGLNRNLPASGEALWQKIGAKVRNQVRKAKKSGCRVVLGGAELLDKFYIVFSENMRDLGSPVHDRMLFEQMVHHLTEQLQILAVILQAEKSWSKNRNQRTCSR